MASPTFIPSTDGVEVALHELGGTGPTVVLCHATGFCGRVWEPFAARLADRHRCVTFDFRAHGATRTPDEVELAWSGMADDVLAVIDAVADGGPVLALGHSMGGAALILAEDRRPGTVARAWTFEPILIPAGGLEGSPPGPPDIAVRARRRRADFDTRDEAWQRWSARPPLGRLDPRCLQAYVDHGLVDRPDGGVTLACRPDREAEVFEHHAAGAFEALDRISFPLAVAASGDGEGPARMVELAAQSHPWLHLERYDDVSHFGPLEEPERLAEAAARWLGSGA